MAKWILHGLHLNLFKAEKKSKKAEKKHYFISALEENLKFGLRELFDHAFTLSLKFLHKAVKSVAKRGQSWRMLN